MARRARKARQGNANDLKGKGCAPLLGCELSSTASKHRLEVGLVGARLCTRSPRAQRSLNSDRRVLGLRVAAEIRRPSLLRATVTRSSSRAGR